MIFGKPIDEIIRDRHSTRSYASKKVGQQIKDNVLELASQLSNPFDVNVRIEIIECTMGESVKLGTYGMISHAETFMVPIAKESSLANYAIGFNMEALVLYLTSISIGTCWLGGTFSRKNVLKLVDLQPNEYFPVISPIGYPSPKMSFKDSMVKKLSKSSARLPYEKIFFSGSFSKPLSPSDTLLSKCLECLRLAPSSQNKQPWRILLVGTDLHFFAVSDHKSLQINLGIAACHFTYAAFESNLPYHCEIFDAPILRHPEYVYCFTLVNE